MCAIIEETRYSLELCYTVFRKGTTGLCKMINKFVTLLRMLLNQCEAQTHVECVPLWFNELQWKTEPKIICRNFFKRTIIETEIC